MRFKEAVPKRTESDEVQELREFLEAFEFDTLRDIVREEIEKSGGDVSRADRIQSDRFKIKEKFTLFRHAAAVANTTTGNTSLSAEQIGYSGEVTKIHVIAHESLHQVVASTCWQDSPLGTITRALGTITGMSTDKSAFKEIGALSRRFLLFDEGMTDLIADEIGTEYARRARMMRATPTRSLSANEDRDWHSGYTFARAIAKSFIEVVAEKTDVEPRLVWKAIKRHYFTDGLNGETKRMLDDLLGDNFIKKLSTLPLAPEEGAPLLPFINEYLREHMPEKMLREFEYREEYSY